MLCSLKISGKNRFLKEDIGMAQNRKRKKQGVITWLRHIKLHDHPYIFVLFIHRQKTSDKYIGMVSCSFVCLSCVMTPPFSCFEPSLYPPSIMEEMIFPLVELLSGLTLKHS